MVMAMQVVEFDGGLGFIIFFFVLFWFYVVFVGCLGKVLATVVFVGGTGEMLTVVVVQ